MPPTYSATLSAHLLGPFHVFVHGNPLPPLRAHTSELLLAYLLLHPDEDIPRTLLAERLWPDSPGDVGRNNLNSALTDLRHALDSEAYRLHSPTKHTVRFNVAGAWVDVQAFAVASAREEWTALQEVMQLYRGPLLEGWGEEEKESWIRPLRDKWRRRCVQAANRMAERALQNGSLMDARNTLRHLVELDELEEVRWRELLQAMLDREDYKAASQTYNELRKYKPVLTEVTKRLYQQIPARERRKKLQRDQIRRSLLQKPRYLPHPLVDFIGRTSEMQDIERLLETARLVTLLGTGGIGKTRLALEAAHRLAEDFADSAVWVELAAVTEAAFLPHAIASALEIGNPSENTLMETLLDFLRAKHLLLVIDNCEHLIEACAELVTSLLHGCPGLHILATSREALRVPGEHKREVQPLTVPSFPQTSEIPLPCERSERIREGAKSQIGRGLGECESVRLFVTRAQAVSPAFALTEENAETVARICIRLEGIPLAIELTAAQTTRPLTEVLSGLERRFEFLVSDLRCIPSRHRSLQAALAYSFERLPEERRVFFTRCSVFRGGWTAEAAAEVCEDSTASALLEHLCAVSLFRRQQVGDTMRYSMLETVREFATEQTPSEEEPELRRRHDAFYRDFAFSQPTPEQFGFEHLNIQRAIEFELRTARHAIEPRLLHCEPLQRYWHDYLSVPPLYEWLRGCELLPMKDAPSLHARVQVFLGHFAIYRADYEQAEVHLLQARRINEEIGDRHALAGTLANLATLEESRGNCSAALTYCEAYLKLLRELELTDGIPGALNALATVALDRGDLAKAEAHALEALTLCRQQQDNPNRGNVLGMLGEVSRERDQFEEALRWHQEGYAWHQGRGDTNGAMGARIEMGKVWQKQGRYAAARAVYREALEQATAQNRQPGAYCFHLFADLALAEGETCKAARLIGAYETIVRKTHNRMPPSSQQYKDRIQAAFAEEETFARFLAEGHAMTLQEALACALEEKT